MARSRKLKKKYRSRLLLALLVVMSMLASIYLLHYLKPFNHIRSVYTALTHRWIEMRRSTDDRQKPPNDFAKTVLKPLPAQSQVQFEFYKTLANSQVKMPVAEQKKRSLQKAGQKIQAKSHITQPEELEKDMLKHIK